MRGRFITLEGIEGAGKSTAAQLIGGWLEARGIRHRLTREPGGTPLAERLRQVALERGAETLAPIAETLIMFAARAIHLDNLIRPALAAGEWIVCDRFTDATRAYQGAGRGIDSDWIEDLAAAVHGDLEPDCTLLLDLPVAQGLARARARSGAHRDRFEVEAEAFFERVRARYLELARRAPSRIRVVNAGAPLEVVQQALAEQLASLVPAEA